MTFKVGDIVEAFGVRGVVTTVNGNGNCEVRFSKPAPLMESWFFKDGRLSDWHAAPSLKLIERPRKTKKVKVWVNCGLIGSMTYPVVYTHPSEEVARNCALNDSVTQQIEVEVLDEV